MNEATPTRPRSRRMLILLAALFLVPLAVSFYLYYASGWRPGGQVNHGELITPPRALPAVSLATPDGRNTESEFLRGDWSILYVGAGACDEHCRKALYTIRQVRLALGEKMDRVQRVFLYTGGCCEQPFFGTEHAGLVAANIDSPAGAELLREFPEEGAPPATGRIYLVDPLGNLMMNYPPDAPAKGMIEDLKRLLKLSHIG
jgi:hypothetical protein